MAKWVLWKFSLQRFLSLRVAGGTLIFRRTYLGQNSEMGINCVAEAGARLEESALLSGQALSEFLLVIAAIACDRKGFGFDFLLR